MKILCDFHHGELYESILKVFERRLGATVYRPVGVEWYKEGFWTISTADSTIDQYLGYRFSSSGSIDGTFVEDAGEISKNYPTYYDDILNIYGHPPHKSIRLDAAKDFGWDIIITTHPGHYDCMSRFHNTYCPRAKHIIQIGNMVPSLPPGVKNVMNSTSTDHSYVPNYLEYYQEFDTTTLTPQPPIENGKIVTTFLIYNSAHRGEDFWKLNDELSDWKFREYGVLNRDGDLRKYSDQCDRLRETAFLWHVKLNGDGYGYNLYRALYAGKPVILNYGTVYKTHRLAQLQFLQDGRTIIDYDGKSISEIANSLRKMRDNWDSHSSDIIRGIRNIVNFDNEFENIKKFLEKLI